jgi:hypothetical protein
MRNEEAERNEREKRKRRQAKRLRTDQSGENGIPQQERDEKRDQEFIFEKNWNRR